MFWGRSDAWLNGASPCPQAGQRSFRRLPWREQAIVVARRHSLRPWSTVRPQNWAGSK